MTFKAYWTFNASFIFILQFLILCNNALNDFLKYVNVIYKFFRSLLMFDLTLIKDLTEIIAKSLNFNDIEAMGKYFFKNYSTHSLENIMDSVTISPFTAANCFVHECQENNKIEELFKFVIELDENLLNGRKVNLKGLENFLYRLSRTGVYFDFNSRKFVKFNQDKKILNNWGALKDGKEYKMVIASVDICKNSELVKKFQPTVMERIYYRLWDYINKKCMHYNGRIWSWAGDGGILAFRTDKDIDNAVNCCFELQFSLPLFNIFHSKEIQEDIQLRAGLDIGNVNFFNDTGRIVSDVINYASHLEKKHAKPNGVSVSIDLYNLLNPKLQKMFKYNEKFDDRTAYSFIYDFKKSIV